MQRRHGAEIVHLRRREIAHADRADLAGLERSFIAPAVSSNGTFGSGQCT